MYCNVTLLEQAASRIIMWNRFLILVKALKHAFESRGIDPAHNGVRIIRSPNITYGYEY